MTKQVEKDESLSSESDEDEYVQIRPQVIFAHISTALLVKFVNKNIFAHCVSYPSIVALLMVLRF